MSDLKTELEWILAIHFSGNRMPHMSGDPRNRLSPGQRLRLDDVVQSIMDMIQKREQAARREALDDAIAAVIKRAEELCEPQCCGIGHYDGGYGPPECCGDPYFMINDRDAVDAIRSLTKDVNDKPV